MDAKKKKGEYVIIHFLSAALPDRKDKKENI